jgi:hypothetical protein
MVADVARDCLRSHGKEKTRMSPRVFILLSAVAEMIRLSADLRPATLLVAIPLAACAAAPPYAPTVLAIPRSGESVNQFQADDLACRKDMQTHTAPPGAAQAAASSSAGGNTGAGAAVDAGAGPLTGSAAGASNADAIAGGALSQYDVAYAQCMTSKGYTVETMNLATATAPPGYAYPGGYPYAYAYPGDYPYYGAYPYFIGTVPFFFFGPRFHGDFHHHGGFHHEGFGHEGFHHGGFGHGGGHFGH